MKTRAWELAEICTAASRERTVIHPTRPSQFEDGETESAIRYPLGDGDAD